MEEVSHLHVWSLTEEKMVVTVHVEKSDVTSFNDAGKVKQEVQNIFRDLDAEHISIDLKYKTIPRK